MQKGLLVESVLLALNGGSLTDESAVKRVDIKAYLPSAVNYAMTKSYNINIQVERSRDISGLFWGAFRDLPIIRDDNRMPRINLPKGTVALPRNQGIRRLIDGCDGVYTPLMDGDLHTIKYFAPILSGSKFFRLFPTYIELHDLNPLVETVKELDMIVRTEDLLDTDELPIPAGMEDDVINLCLRHFDPQRQSPADKINNTVDLNSQ